MQIYSVFKNKKIRKHLISSIFRLFIDNREYNEYIDGHTLTLEKPRFICKVWGCIEIYAMADLTSVVIDLMRHGKDGEFLPTLHTQSK